MRAERARCRKGLAEISRQRHFEQAVGIRQSCLGKRRWTKGHAYGIDVGEKRDETRGQVRKTVLQVNERELRGH